MPSRIEPIVISDDDDDEDDIEVIIDHRPRQSIYEADGAGPSTRSRHDLSASPSLHRDAKRPRLDQDISSTGHGAVVKSEFPRIKINFETDENGNSQLYPNFFEDAFVLNPTPNNEEVQIMMEVPRQEEEPPYFEDPKLQIRMYRGPGYEHFPIPFNTSHQEYCDLWDEKRRKRLLQQTRYNAFGAYIDPTAPFKDSDDGVQSSNKLSTAQTECLARIVDVLPDVDRDFVVEKIKSQQESYTFQDEEIEILPDVSTIISEILEMENYPKEAKIQQQTIPYERETGQTIAWLKDHRQNKDYLKDALIVLASQFDYVPTHYINRIVLEKKNLWDSFVHIDEIDRNYFQRQQRPYVRSRRPRTALEKKYQRSSPYRDPDYYQNVVLELQAVKQHQLRETLKKEEYQQKINKENENLEQHKANGLIVTCGCCFDEEIPINRAVVCTAETAEHSFCFSCVEQLANTQIGMMRHEMSCMDGSDCKARLDMEGIGRAIPYKTFNKLLLNEQQAEIAAANLEGLEQCPFCDFKAICDPIEVDTIFSCQNPDCFKVTCRKCHEISHLPQSCEDIKKDRGLSARHKVEEARSAAMMRPCPQCKTNLIKEMGCNKMRCRCGAAMCYVCKADLSKLKDPYSHFDKHTSAGEKCALYDTPGVDRHIQEANDAEIEAIRAAKEADSTIEEKMLQIETGRATAAVNIGSAWQGDPIGRFAYDDIRRRLEREERRAEVERQEARARRRVQVLQAPPPYIPLIGHQQADYPIWPGHVAPHTPVQPGDANVDAWRNAVRFDNTRQPNQQFAPFRGHHGADDQAVVVDNPHAEWQGFDDFEPMDLDINYNQHAQAQRDANQADNIAAARRQNDFRNEIHRRRTHRQRRHSDRNAAPAQPIIPPMPQLGNQLRTPLDQQNGLLGDVYQQGLRIGQQLEQLGQQLNANPWRAQYRPPTPVPERPNARNENELLQYRGLPFRRGTIPPIGNGNTIPIMQAAPPDPEQAQIQHRPHDNDFYGFL